MLLILDGNNLAWAGFHALRRPMGADTPERKERAALLGLAQAVFGILVRAGEPPDGRPGGQGRLFDGERPRVTGLAVAFDEGRPVRRRSIYPAYQTGREADPSFAENEPHILAAISAFEELAAGLPIEVLRGVNTEADDLIAARALQETGPVRIASTDRDFLQLVDERVSIYSPVKKAVVDAMTFADHAAPRDAEGRPAVFPRERYLDFRAASGDSSDDLPGIPGMGALTAARLLAAAPLDAYFEAPGRAAEVLGRRNAKLEAALASGEARAIAERNRALMDLRAAARLFPDLGGYRRAGEWRPAVLERWLEEQRAFGIDRAATLAAFERLAEATGTAAGR
ncbi:MAG: hypothetical protein WHT63_09510 [Tepidiforma sp.]